MRVLMCPPAYYKIPAKENVHMDSRVQPNPHLAWLQWLTVRNLLEKFGVRVFEMEPQPHLYSMVFAANGGWGRYNERRRRSEVVLANFLNPTRQGEKEYCRRWLRRLGSVVYELPEHIVFEGQGDVITTSQGYVMAYGIRSSPEAPEYVQRLLELKKPTIQVCITDERFYHLDTCMCSLRFKNALVYYPGAFDEPSLARIRQLNLIRYEISEALAIRFVCNSVFVGNDILLNVPDETTEQSFEMSADGKALSAEDRRLEELVGRNPEYGALLDFLRRLGYESIPVYTSELFKSGAGVRCLIQFLD